MLRCLYSAVAISLFAAVGLGPVQANYDWPLELNAGWQEAVVSVSDLAQWQTHLADIAGWQPVHEGPVDPC